MASLWTLAGAKDLVDNGVASDLRLLLVDTPPASQETAEDLVNVSEVTADELAGTGYGRATLTGEGATVDDPGNRTTLDADDPATYSGLDAGTIAGGWVFRQVTNDADSVLWCFVDCDDLVTNGSDVDLSFASGAFAYLANP